MKKKEEEMESPKKEEIAEDWCFVCKEGGLLMVCEYKNCLKAYHPYCVEKSESDLEGGNYWTCNLHICMVCRRSPDVCCLCCPKAVCWQCMKDEQIVHVKEGKGFCSECLRLSLMIEEKVDVDSDGDPVDFYDINTWEGLYKEYWDIINKQEGLTLETLHAADARMKKGNKKTDSDEKKRRRKKKSDKRYGPVLEEHDGCEENEYISDTDSSNDTVKRKSKRKTRRSRKQTSVSRNVKRKEFIGWGSKALIQFLQSINVNVTEKLTQDHVTSIINRYIKEKNLFHQNKKRKVVSDESLQSLFGRKMFNKHRVHDFLDAHFAENYEPLEDETENDSEDKNDIFPAVKRQIKMSDLVCKQPVKYNVTQYHYASIVPGNINLLYLRRSYVQKLAEEEEPDTFDNKVIGSFVKVKSDPNDYIQRERHKLMQVTGTTWTSDGENKKKVLLKVTGSSTLNIGTNYLSESDVTKEDCEELKQYVESGSLKQPTVAELTEKAAILYEGRVKHGLDRELRLLQNRIDQANEKGWRIKLFEYLEKKKKLLASREELLRNIPAVIPADMTELEFMSDDVKDEISVKSVTSGSRGKKHQFYGSEEHANTILKSKVFQFGPTACWISDQSIQVDQGREKSPEVDSGGVDKDSKKNVATQTD